MDDPARAGSIGGCCWCCCCRGCRCSSRWQEVIGARLRRRLLLLRLLPLRLLPLPWGGSQGRHRAALLLPSAREAATAATAGAPAYSPAASRTAAIPCASTDASEAGSAQAATSNA